MFTNVLRALAVGLTLGLLSPAIGANFTEVHDVNLRVSRGGRVIATHHFGMRTDLTMGFGGDTQAASRELDQEQMNRIAEQIVELVVADVGSSTARVGVRVNRKS